MDAGDPGALTIAPHITLLPPTAVRPDRMDDVRAHLREIADAHAPFVVTISGTDSFRPVSPVVYIAVVEGVEQCEELSRAVNDWSLAQPPRFPYHPHVTIAHDLDDAALDAAEQAQSGFHARFPVAEFGLYEYGDDGMWREVETFALVSRD